MGGGALGSENVSELVEFCHCEERSDVALYQYPASYGSQVRLRCKPIAKSLHIDEITTSHFANAPRNDINGHLERSERSQSYEILRLTTRSRKTDTLTLTSSARAPQNDSKKEIAQLVRDDMYCHAELADCELRAELDGKMAKPLQTSIVDPLNASNQAVSASQTETVFSRFTKPSRGTSEARVEQESMGTLSSRCDCERCRLMRGAVASKSHKVAFTLAEVLITLGVIGVVAVIIMPALIANIQDHVKAKRIENIRQKLSKVTDAMSATSGINGYADTMEFVTEMNKHMKIAKICDNDHLSACWPTQEVMLNDEGKMWEISKTKNPKTLKVPKGVQGNYTNTVGIVTADGTSMILSYNKNCNFNPEVTGYVYSGGLSNSASCLAGVFDWNGGKSPNKLGKDVITLGVASGLGNDCAFEIGNKCFSAPFIPTPLTRTECEGRKSELGIKGCVFDNDYWAGAVAECGGVDKMPTMEDLGKLATELYKEHPTVGAHQEIYSGLTLDTSVTKAMGFPNETFFVWSGEEFPQPEDDLVDAWAIMRVFDPSDTWYCDNLRMSKITLAVCSAD